MNDDCLGRFGSKVECKYECKVRFTCKRQTAARCSLAFCLTCRKNTYFEGKTCLECGEKYKTVIGQYFRGKNNGIL
jgi:hypothetical protein